MDNRQRAREWLRNVSGDDLRFGRDEVEVRLAREFAAIRRETLTEAADRVADALQGIPMCGQTGCAEVAACDVRRVEAEIRALATPTKPGDEQ